MKTNIIAPLFLFSTFSLCASGADFYWGATSGDWGNSSANWLDSAHAPTDSAPSGSDKIIFDGTYSNGAAAALISVSQQTVRDVVFQNSYLYSSGAYTVADQKITTKANVASTLTVLGNLTKSRGASNGNAILYSKDANSKLTVHIAGTAGDSSTGNIYIGKSGDATSGIAGNLSFGESSAASSIAKLTVANNILMYMGSSLYLNVGTGIGTSANPDVEIKGIISMTGSGSANPTIYLNHFTGTTRNLYMKVGGISGNGVITMGSGVNGTTTLEFTNAAGTNYTYAGYLNSGTSSSANIKIVMNGQGTQRIAPTWEPDKYVKFSGLECRSGKLQIFTYLTVGDISMTGGKLEAISVTAHYSTDPSGSSKKLAQVHGKDMIWDSGTIITSVEQSAGDPDVGYASMVYLSGGLIKGDAFTKMRFEFTGDLYYMEEEWIKIMEFAGGADGFVASDFEAADYLDYTAVFKIENNALYAMYTEVVPEPATCAAILGAIALGLAMYRRRK